VAGLLILDARPDADPDALAETRARDERDWIADMAESLERVYGIDLGLDRAGMAAAEPGTLRRRLAERAGTLGALSAGEVASVEARFAVLRQATLTHVAEPCDGVLDCPIVQFRAEEAIEGQQTAPADLGEDWGWQRRSRQPVVVQRVHGDHHSMLREPHVQALAAALCPYLDQPVGG